MTTQILKTADISWTVPSEITSVVVHCVGAGGNGVKGGGGSRNGGGGGAYSSSTISVTPGNAITVQIGAGGSGTDTWFSSSATVMAKAGTNATTGAAAPGGLASSGVGTVKFSGGDGGRITNSNCFGGGGGGGTGGPNGDGGAGGRSSQHASFNGNGAGGGGGANAGSVGANGSTPTGSAQSQSGAGGAGGANRLAAGAGASPSGNGSSGGGGGGGQSATDSGTGGIGSFETLWTDDSGGAYNTQSIGPGAGGGGGSGGAPTNQDGGAGSYGAGGGGCRDSAAVTAGTGGEGFIVLVYSVAGPAPAQRGLSLGLYLGL